MKKYLPLFLLGFLFFAPKAHAAISQVQLQTSYVNPGTGNPCTSTITFASPTTAGDAIVIETATHFNNTGFVTVSDATNGAYTKASDVSGDGTFDGTIYYKLSAASINTVSVAEPECYEVDIVAFELSGVGGFDSAGGYATPSYNSYSSVTATTTLSMANDFLIGQGGNPPTAPPTFNANWAIVASDTRNMPGNQYYVTENATTTGVNSLIMSFTSNFNRPWVQFAGFYPAPPPTCSYYRAITVTSTTSVASGTNANFPMLFSGTYSWLAATSSSGRIQNVITAPNGGKEPADLWFTSSTPTASGTVWVANNTLAYETESYASSTGAIVDWINVPSLAAGTILYACYGNSSVTTDQSRPASTWNSNYVSVYHLNEGGGATSTDSTANANNGTNTSLSATSSPTMDGASNFNGTGSYTESATSTSQNFTGPVTLDSWFYETDNSNYRALIDKGVNGARDYAYFLVLGSTNAIYYDSVGALTLSNSWSLNTWNHVVLTDDGTNIKVYLNGVLSYTGTGGVGATNGCMSSGGAKCGIYVGIEQGGNGGFTNYPFAGNLDEARVAKAVFTTSWIASEYNNENSPSTFYAIGAEQTAGGGGGSGEGAILFLIKWATLLIKKTRFTIDN